MSVHFLGGYLYGCYSTGTVGIKRHQREIVGDFGDVSELRPRLLDNVGIDVGKAGGVDRICAVQLPFNKDGKD